MLSSYLSRHLRDQYERIAKFALKNCDSLFSLSVDLAVKDVDSIYEIKIEIDEKRANKTGFDSLIFLSAGLATN